MDVAGSCEEQQPLPGEELDFIGHLTQLSPEDVMAANYCRYVALRINAVPVSALVDSGNVWRNVMSVELFRELGLSIEHDLRPAQADSIQTAKAGSQLTIIGEMKKPVNIRMGGVDTNFPCRFIVVEGLSHRCNLSGPFLQEHSIDQIHSNSTLMIKGHEVPLLSSKGQRAQLQDQRDMVSDANVYMLERTTVPAQSWKSATLIVPAVERALMHAGPVLVAGCAEFMDRTDTHLWVSAIGCVATDGTV